MQKIKCPICGQETSSETACQGCGKLRICDEVAVTQGQPDANSWVAEPVPPEVREHFLHTFDETEYWAALAEAEKAEGAGLDEFLTELEQRVHGEP